MSMAVGVVVNAADIAAVQGMLRQILRNNDTGVPEAITKVLESAKKLAGGITHIGATGKLHVSWQVQRQFNRYSLVNLLGYAGLEFDRGGVKTGGRPPLGTPHNVMPNIIDFINSNLESAVTKAMMANIRR